MAKKKRRRTRKAVGFGASPTQTELSQVAIALQNENWVEARDLLEELARRYPKKGDILAELVNVCYELKDFPAYQEACERLLKVTPDDADANFGLAGAYFLNSRPMLALQTFRRCLECWPEHERVPDARKAVAKLEAAFKDLLSDMGLANEKTAVEVAALHERVQIEMGRGNYRTARAAVESLLTQLPNFVPALNNLSMIDGFEGKSDRAIAIARQVLEIEPENFQALANLVRYLRLSGQTDAAREVGEELKRVESKSPDVWVKKAEALSFLGDDRGVWEAFEQGERAQQIDLSSSSALLYHLAAVASMRLGDTKRARHLWQKALQQSAGYDVAQANLKDLELPSGQRHSPWSFPLTSWLNKETVEELTSQIPSDPSKMLKGKIAQVTRSYLERHPELIELVPILLDRGDLPGRTFALSLAHMAKTPEMLAALRDFALSQWGPDEMRYEAARTAVDADLLPMEGIRMWLRGRWEEVVMLRFDLHAEPTIEHSTQVNEWLGEALSILRGGDADKAVDAEHLIEKGLELEPDSPPLLYNLTVAYELQGRWEEADELSHQIFERFPDYLFGRVHQAKQHLRQGELDAAAALLQPLRSRKRFHFDEFAGFCDAYLELLMAQKKPEAVKAWLNVWEEVDPDNPEISAWKLRLAGSTLRKRLHKFLPW